MAEDMYKKIEKRILSLKEKEDAWKGRYKEMAQEVRGFVKSASSSMEGLEAKIKGLQERDLEIERAVKKTGEKSAELAALMDKKINHLSELLKNSSLRNEENSLEIKRIKSDILLQVNAMISKHEKTFDTALEKIMVATRKMEDETRRAESVYEKMVAARDFMQPAPPAPARQQIAEVPVKKPAVVPLPADPPPDPPENFLDAPSSPPIRKRPRRMPVFDDDLDDMDVDDVLSGVSGIHGEKDFHASVDDMHRNVGSLADKLSSIEQSVSKMQVQRGSVEKLEDKIQAYTESVAGIHSRMDTIERAMRDGMTPMMESMKLLADAVKELKGKPVQPIQKPKPPIKRALEAVPSNRTPPAYQYNKE